MKNYVKLFESFFDEQKEVLHKLGKVLGLHGHADTLELMLDYAAKHLRTTPENISVKKISKEDLLDIKKNYEQFGMIDLNAFGAGGAGIDILSHGEMITKDQYAEIRDKISDENPDLFKDNGMFKNTRAFNRWYEIRNKETQKYATVLATGLSGIFLLKVLTTENTDQK